MNENNVLLPTRNGLRELHLFAGAGGGILGGILLGHTTVCAVEIEPYCRKVLLQRQRDGILPKFPIWDDIRTFDGKPWRGKVEVVCGGFPCQDISCAGKGKGITGERSGLWGEMARIIGEIRPRFAFVENSPMLTIRGIDRVLGDFSEMGYDAKWGVVSAADIGAPHLRERIWILGIERGAMDRNTHTIKDPKVKKVQRRKQTSNTSGVCAAIAVPKVSNTHANNSAGSAQQGKQFAGSAQPVGGCIKRMESRGDLAYADKEGLQGRKKTTIERGGYPDGHARTQGSSVPDPELRGCEEQRGQVSPGITPNGGWWKSEPNVGRVALGVASRVDRLKAIGNGQVPIVAASAWRILSEGLE